LRLVWVTGEQESGFILPTVTLLLIMLSLVIGTLVFRTYGRTTEVVGQRQQQVLYNAATPSVERAKSKIEYLFTQSGIGTLPTEDSIESELKKSSYNLSSLGSTSAETRLDIDGDGVADNAWLFTTSYSTSGTQQTIAYSILTRANANLKLQASAAQGATTITVNNGNSTSPARVATLVTGTQITIQGASYSYTITGVTSGSTFDTYTISPALSAATTVPAGNSLAPTTSNVIATSDTSLTKARSNKPLQAAHPQRLNLP
jgi:hypothetical protein